MNSMRSSLLFLAALPLFAGCAAFASHTEYGAFRAFRLESNTERRIALGAEYVEAYPTGRFRSAVESDVQGREEEYWEEKRSTYEGLQVYLRAFPRGAHQQEATTRIQSYEEQRRHEQEEQRQREEEERRRLAEERRQSNERQRMFARNNIHYWLRTLGAIDGWGETLPNIAQRNPDFNTAFAGEPPPQCRGPRCRKSYQLNFTIPVPGRTALSRRLNMALDLFRREQRLQQAAVVFHNRGLSNWYECETQGACDVSDETQRQNSVRWAMDQLRGVVASAFPEARETPASLVGPEPEMEGELGEDAEPPATNPGSSPIPPQPLGVQFSYIVGNCNGLGGAVISVPEGARPEGWASTIEQPLPVRACLRIDAYSALNLPGISTDEGLRISYIQPSALPAVRPAAPARPGRRPAPAAPAPRR